MKGTFLVFLVLHGAIHLLGFAKAFGLATLPQLAEPISRPMGVLWLLAALAFGTTAALVAVDRGKWWLAALAALALSQAAIASSWGDARFGTAANVVVLMALVLWLFDQTASSVEALR